MLNKILRCISNITHWMLFGLLVTIVAMGRNNIFITILLCIYGIEIFFGIKNAISMINSYRKMYKKYQAMFKALKYVHKAKYRAYFSGDMEEVERITKDFNECADEFLKLGETLLQDKEFSSKQKNGIQEIISQTKDLIENIKPPV